MKRSSLVPLILGAVVSVIIIIAHGSGLLGPLEQALENAFAGSQPHRVVASALQYMLVLLFSFGAIWLVMTSTQKTKVSWALGALMLELLFVAWVSGLYRVFFQPLPSILALGLGLAAAHGYPAALSYVPAQVRTVERRRGRPHIVNDLFSGRLAEEEIARFTSGELAFDPTPKSYEATAVVCDIANKHDLADECPPAQVAEITEKFTRHAADSFLRAGAYIDTITGEGIVAVFGFPAEDAQQAEKATRHALSLVDSFEKMRDNGEDGCFAKFDVHVGISSGTMIVVPRQDEERATIFSTGEPVELARRFCIANRFYGSRILIGPRTFELASKSIVARPIDFLSGVDARERHEIYEPLKLATEASPEDIARRDSFWNGVVLYREKRWAEAYSQFQKARGSNEHNDAPLQLYVRRLEPLALHLVDAPLE